MVKLTPGEERLSMGHRGSPSSAGVARTTKLLGGLKVMTLRWALGQGFRTQVGKLIFSSYLFQGIGAE